MDVKNKQIDSELIIGAKATTFNRIAFGILLTVVASSASAQQLRGIYKSNFADLGFFITTINFTSDSTFDYEFSGDLIQKNFRGHYSIRQPNVYLRFSEVDGPTFKVDSVEYVNSNYHNYELKEEKGLKYHLKYRIEEEKLYIYRVDNEELVRTTKFYNGKSWVSREWYLGKIN